MKVLIDTNVILDFFLSREPHFAEAKQVFEMIRNEEIEAFTTAGSITDIYYVVAKRQGNNFAGDAIMRLLGVIGIITVSGEDCVEALDLPLDDFEDSLVTVCADKEKVNIIISNDKKFIQTNPNLAVVISAATFINRQQQQSAKPIKYKT